MKQIITCLVLAGLCLNPQLTTAQQCDAFAQKLLNTLKKASYQDFRKLFEPTEKKRKRMQWPETQEATNYLNALDSTLYKALIQSSKHYRDSLNKLGWDMAKASYTSCERSPGINSAIKVNFKIYNRDESFIVQIYQSDNTIYLTDVLKNGKEGFQTLIKSFTVIDNKKYGTFKPRKDELAKGSQLLKRYLQEKEIEDYDFYATLGLIDLVEGIYMEFLVRYGENSQLYVIVDLGTGECQEVFK